VRMFSNQAVQVLHMDAPTDSGPQCVPAL